MSRGLPAFTKVNSFIADQLEVTEMKRRMLICLSALATSASLFAQGTSEIDRALAAAPAQTRNDTTVIKWKPDFTYETLKKGTNRLVCYDRSGYPEQQPISIECTSMGNLDREAQN